MSAIPIDYPIVSIDDADLRAEALKSLAALGFETRSDKRLYSIRAALFHPASRYTDLPDPVRHQVKELIDSIIGTTKPKLTKQKRATAPLDFTYLDAMGCTPELRTLIINRFPRRPYCTDSLESGLAIRSLDSAIKKSYIQHNPQGWKSVIVVDVDRQVINTEWSDAGLPAPTWITINPKNGHAHYAWTIKNPVWAGGANQRPTRYVEAIIEAYRARLNGDPGFSNLITKNPISPVWTVESPSNFATYELADLSRYVDLKGIKKKRRDPSAIDGLGRNCTLFDEVRDWAYSVVRNFADCADFSDAVYDRTAEMNVNFSSPLSYVEIKGIAKSISKWTWLNRRIHTDEFIALQSRRGKRSGDVRAARSEPARLVARSKHEDGLTLRAIAAQLNVGKSTIARWLK